MLNACEASGLSCLEEDSLSRQEQSPIGKTEKLAFGVKYSVKNLPVDIYEYVPKDSMDMYMPLLEVLTDSIYFTRRKADAQCEGERVKETKLGPAAIGGGRFSAVVGRFKHKTSLFTIGFSLNLAVSYTEPIESLFQFRDANLYLTDEMASIEFGNGFQLKNESYRITDVYFNPDVDGMRGGMACTFSAHGEVHGELSMGFVTIHSGCLVEFESEGRACEYPRGSNYKVHFTPHF